MFGWLLTYDKEHCLVGACPLVASFKGKITGACRAPPDTLHYLLRSLRGKCLSLPCARYLPTPSLCKDASSLVLALEQCQSFCTKTSYGFWLNRWLIRPHNIFKVVISFFIAHCNLFVHAPYSLAVAATMECPSQRLSCSDDGALWDLVPTLFQDPH